MRCILWVLMMLCFLFIPTKEAMHMYQQNRYQLPRYHTWLKGVMHIKSTWIGKMLVSCLPLACLCLLPNWMDVYPISMMLLIVYTVVMIRWDVHHAYIKKIKFTYRIRRLTAAFCVSYAIVFIVLYQLCDLRVLMLLMPLFFFLPWIWLEGVASLMKPLEEAIRNSYAKEAKAMLKDRDHLIKVGITGSYGKTSVKNILYSLLSTRYYTFMTPHSYNNLMGLTISIRKLLKPIHEVFIAEMGADHVGEITLLAHFIEPTVGIVSAVGPQHLETFGSQENILLEKMQMIECLPQDGVGIINYDNEWIRSYPITNSCKIMRYGIHEKDVDVFADHIQYSPQGTTFQVHYQNREFTVSTCLLGEHNVCNILAAICAAKALQISDADIQRALKQQRFVEHRLEVRKTTTYTILDDAYNANPQGANYALDVLSQMPGVRYIMTPGFLDLGDEKQSAHHQLAKKIVECADVAILIGQTQTQDILEALLQEGYDASQIHVLASVQEGFALLSTLADQEDTVLIENDLPDAFNH